MAKEENDILNRWLLKWRSWGKLFRNNTGQAWAGIVVDEWKNKGENFVTLRGAYRIAFGMLKGSADYIGWHTITVTPDMVGKKIAIFASVEGKTKDGTLTEEQKIWLMNVRRAGGISFVVRSEDTKPSEWEDFGSQE